LWALALAITCYVLPDWEKRGQAGDLFGSINALFSGLAFAGVIVAILLQREELQLQRDELTYTRRELERTADAQEKAQEALNQTIYAQTFRVAVEILDSREMVEARAFLTDWIRSNWHSAPPSDWTEGTRNSADTVIRGLDAVGTYIRRGLIPADYIVTNRSRNILQWWNELERYVEHIRVSRSNHSIGVDFEWLANAAQEYLDQPPKVVSKSHILGGDV
jgi:uncharacterized membrane protein YccC